MIDNTGLQAACEESERVIPAFVFDPRQCDPEENSFFSKHAFTFLVQSLYELREKIQARNGRLYCFEGDPVQVVRELVREDDVSAVYVNRDYTPFSRRRDDALRSACAEEGAAFRQYDDLLLTEPEDVRPEGGGAYHTFSPFRRHAQSQPVPRPKREVKGSFYRGAVTLGTIYLEKYDRYSPDGLRVEGGRTEGVSLLAQVGNLQNYWDLRHQPAAGSFTGLSAHHKFGTVSIRESLAAAQECFDDYHKLLSQLYWRDFYTHLLFHRPEQLTKSLRPIGRHIPWRNERGEFDRWCAGNTGVPLVDAGMRELNQTGYMHNRSRMVVASFLTKDLLVDWRWGGSVFRQDPHGL